MPEKLSLNDAYIKNNPSSGTFCRKFSFDTTIFSRITLPCSLMVCKFLFYDQYCNSIYIFVFRVCLPAVVLGSIFNLGNGIFSFRRYSNKIKCGQN